MTKTNDNKIYTHCLNFTLTRSRIGNILVVSIGALPKIEIIKFSSNNQTIANKLVVANEF